jgi:hypothetical protein
MIFSSASLNKDLHRDFRHRPLKSQKSAIADLIG